MRSTKYTRDVLEPIVRSSYTWAEVLTALGLPLNGGNHRLITARVRNAGLDTSHFQGTLAVRCHAVPPSTLADAVRNHTSLAGVLRALKLPTVGRAHHVLKARIEELGLDTQHFRGRGWSRGETRATHPAVERYVRRRERTDADIFVENSDYLTTKGLVRRLRAMGWAYRCAWCGLSEWRNAPLVLHLDHINGINNDHRLENLRFLCPNCHSQTDTYCNRRR